MAIKPYLDRVGLTNLWANIKAYVTSRVPTKVSELTNDSGYITGVSWNNISGKPSTFTPSSHTHDDRYYTEGEINTKLSGKSDTGHTHDDRYYTETEVNNLLSGKANTSGTYSSLTVGNATKATKDGDGNVISTTYGKLASANTWSEENTFTGTVTTSNLGATLNTYTKKDGIVYFSHADNSSGFIFYGGISYNTPNTSTLRLSGDNNNNGN